MTTRSSLVAAAVSAALLTLPLSVLACSTVIVGKNISETGKILIGHNEDNGGRIMNAQYWVPPAKHKAGEMITYEPTAAKIPQVRETLGFYWSQTLSPKGQSFSDGFVNEAGVVIVSNNCSMIFDKDQKLTNGGIGYGIRRLLAERAHSAREAIDIAADLLAKYGYNAEGRTYTIADGYEAWQLAIHKGNMWIARKIQDNEIVYIPNNFMLGKVDVTDKDNVITSPGLIERLIKTGHYKPAKAGDYSDFNFREAVQPLAKRTAEYNFRRNQIAWEYITGDTIKDADQFPYSVVTDRQFTIKDVQNILRAHEEEIGDDDGWYHHLSYGPCRTATHEAVVFDVDVEPVLIASYRALARPCETPFVPSYPLAKPSENQSFMSAATATKEHFHAQPTRFDYHPEYASMTFVNNANVIDYQRDDFKSNLKFIQKLEKKWAEEKGGIESQARAALSVSEDKALAILHRYNVAKLTEAQGAIQARLDQIAPHKIVILSDTLDPKSNATIKIALLSDEDLDATQINREKTYAGISRASDGKALMSDLAKPTAYAIEDINGDGKKDMVMSFVQKDLAKFMVPGAVYDTYLYTRDGRDRLTAFDTVKVLK